MVSYYIEHIPKQQFQLFLVHTSYISVLKSDTSDKTNYKPIAIVTAMLKILELCIMKLIETHLLVNDNQFGFKRRHGSDLFTTKSVIKYYNLCNILAVLIYIYIYIYNLLRSTNRKIYSKYIQVYIQELMAAHDVLTMDISQ